MRALLLLAMLGACASDGDPTDSAICSDRWGGAGHCARACNAPEPDELPAGGCSVPVEDDNGQLHDCNALSVLAVYDGVYGCCAYPGPAPDGRTYRAWSPCE